MGFELAFHPEALREWRQLTSGIREQFKKKLAERLVEPRIPASKLRNSADLTKIKLRDAGFRLLYEVRDHEVLVLVVAVGKWERNAVYRPTGCPALRPYPMADSMHPELDSCAWKTLV